MSARPASYIACDNRPGSPDDYKDELRSKLRKIIDEQVARQKGRKVKATKEEETQAPEASTNVVDFMELLKRSLEKKGKSPGARAAPQRATRKSAAKTRRSSSKRKAS